MSPVAIRRLEDRLRPDPRRVIAKPYLPGEEIVPGGDTRSALLMRRVLEIAEDDVARLLHDICERFENRHEGYKQLLERHFELVAHHIGPGAGQISTARRLLIGAYYTNEYSVESAALCNPSLVEAPSQAGLTTGHRRVVMSVRAIGEGHISSIGFRTGALSADSQLVIDPPAQHLVTGHRTPPARYDRRLFAHKINELGAGNDLAWSVLARLPNHFRLDELENSLATLEVDGLSHAITYETAKMMRLLAASNYVTNFPPSSALSQRVLFPSGPHETRGMEDARFVRFIDDDGSVRYYATYTAYDGFEILPQLIETPDFMTFAISTLNGSAAQNKGMALFPRKIRGKYVMLSRQDRENLHLATSNDVGTWEEATPLDRPHEPWQLLQIGNCGSPIETDAGWLLITHGVGPMRRYVLGASLLDLDNPARVIGRLREPLMEPDASEREGYVPNVLYSCGGLRNGDDLVLPYGISDGAVGVAVISIPELLAALVSSA
ncbi:MAG TPA: glycoside hydrolase family 130 protein [Polyangia bacterium]